MFGPTVRPRLEGSVHGVVVHAVKKTSTSFSLLKVEFLIMASNRKLLFSFFIALNIATALVSFTSLYVPGWFNSCELKPVPAAGEYGCMLTLSYK